MGTDQQIKTDDYRQDEEHIAREERETAGKTKCKGGCDDYFDPKLLEDGLCPVCKKWVDEEYLDNLIQIIQQAAISHKWMLDGIIIRNKNSQLNKGNDSDELKHAKAVQGLLESI